MKNLFRTRAIALALCVAMVLGIFPGPITAFSVGTDGNNNSVVGAVGVIGAESLLLATAPAGESGHEVMNGVDLAALPAKVVIVETFEGTDNTWYKLDAAPGYTWPAEYDAYRWTYAYSVDITEPNGTTGIFDANGNAVSSLIMPLYNKIKLNAVSSLVGTVKYQWQICYDVDNNLWVDIYGEDSASINVSYGMVYSLMDSNNTVKMRCKATSGSVVNYSYEFPVTVYEVQETPTEPIEPEEATLEIQMNGAAVSSLKYSYSDYNYAAELSAVTSLSGDVTYKWTFIDENGEESAESFTGANVVLEHDTLCKYGVEIDQYTANTLLRVTASNGNQSLTVDVQFVLYYNSSSDYFTGEDGTEVTVLAVSEAIPEGADLELSPAGNSTTLPEGEEVLVALDITLKDAEGNVWQPADDETVSITMWAASLGLEPGDYFAVYHNHNGVIEKMGPYQVTEDGYVTITVTGFSDFVFVSADPESDVGKTAKIVTASVQLAKNPADISVNIKPVSHNDLPEVVQIIGYYYDEVNSQLWYQVTAPTWKEEYNYLRHYAVEIGDYELDPGTGDGESGTQPSDAALKIQCGGKDVTSVDFFFDYETEMTLNAVLSGAEATSYKWEVCSSATNDKWTTLDSVTDTLVAEYFTFHGHWIEASYTMIRVTAEGTGLTAVIRVNRVDEMPEIKPLEGQVTTSDGGTIDVTVSGELPTGGSLSLAEMDNAAITVEDGEELVVALDITVLNADGSEWQPESGDNITISIPADQLGLSDGEWFVVYHVYNGNSSKIGPKTVKNGYVTFVVNSFSEFDFAITEVDYSDSIGMDAVFNIEDGEYGSFMILDEEPTDELQGDVQTYYAEEIPTDLVMSVLDWTAYTTDYDAALWYQVSVKEGTAPDGLGDTFWVLQNYLGEDAFESDALILSKPQPEEPDPEEPTEPEEPEEPAVGVTVDGEPVQEITVSTAQKVVLTAVPNDEAAEITYQWQILIAAANMWVDISGQNTAECTVNYGMVNTVLDAEGKAYIRCKTVFNGTEVLSDPIAVVIAEPSTAAAGGYALGRLAGSSEDDGTDETTPSGQKYNFIVKYYLKDTTEEIYQQFMAEFTNGETRTLNISIPEKVGYSAWWVDATTGEATLITDYSMEYTYTFNGTEDVVYAVRYTPNEVEYVVEHYFQNCYDDNYGEPEIENKTGTADTVVPDAHKTKEGFYHIPYIHPTIAPDGSTVIQIYYDRMYTLMTFDLGDGGYGVEPVYARYETEVTLGTPERPGYVFNGWEYENGTDITTATVTMPAEDIVIVAKWTAGTASYTIVYWKENADPDKDSAGNVILDENNDPVYSYSYWTHRTVTNSRPGAVVNGRDDVAAYVSDEAYFTYNDARTDKNVVVKGDSSSVVNVYYTRNSYTIYFRGTEISGTCAIPEHTHGTGCDTYLICGKSEHTHSEDCGQPVIGCGVKEHTAHTADCLVCGEIAHDHATAGCTYNCGQTNSHTHSTNCYENVGSATMTGFWGKPENPAEGQVYSGRLGKYIFIKGTWYDYEGSLTSGTANVVCGLSESNHEHSEACYNCGLTNHTHTNNCYGDALHTHTESCYTYPDCTGAVAHTHTDACYSECVLLEHTHNTNCNQNRQDNIVYVVTAKYEATIGDIWPTADKFPNVDLYGWNLQSNGNGTTYVSKRINMTSNLCDTSDGLMYLYGQTGGKTQYLHYMFESFDQTSPENGDERIKRNGIYYDSSELYYQVVNGTGNWSAKEILGMEDGVTDTDEDPDIFFFYERLRYTLKFQNVDTVVKTVSNIMYEYPMKDIKDSTGTLVSTFVPDYPANLEEGGYEFAGWYSTPECFEGTQFDFTTGTMPNGDLTLYAKWKPVTHTVKIFLDNTLSTQIGTTQRVPHNNYAEKPENDPVNGTLDFLGWFYKDENGEEKAFSFAAQIKHDLNLYAKWRNTAIINYEIHYVGIDASGNYFQIATPTIGQQYAEKTETFEPKGTEEYFAEYQSAGYFAMTAGHSIVMGEENCQTGSPNCTWNPETKTHTFTFYYELGPVVPYTVRYYYEGTTDPVFTNSDGSEYFDYYPDNRKSVVVAYAKGKVGYKVDEVKKSLVVIKGQTNEIIFYYSKDENATYYEVVHHLMDNNGNELASDTLAYNANIDEVVESNSATVAPLSYDGFTFDEDYVGTLRQGTATKDPILQLHLYYVEDLVKLKYEVVGGETGGGTVSVSEETLGAAYGVANGSQATPISDGYMFVGWYSHWDCKEDQLLSTNPDYVPTKANTALWKDGTTYYAKFEEKEVTLNYVVVGPDGCGTVTPGSETLGAATGTANGSTAVAGKGYEFVGWYSDESCTSSYFLSYDPTWVPQKGEGTIWEDGKTYYAKFEEQEVTINYVAVGPEGATNFGSVSPTSETVPVVTGNPASTATVGSQAFKFVGWYSDAACTKQIATSATYNPAKVDGLHVAATYYAKFEYNQTSLTIKKEGWEDVDPNQTFIFNIKGDGVDMNVTVHGNGSVTINGLTVGEEYTITEVTGWSWRYGFSKWEHQANATSDTKVSGTTNGATITLGLNGIITFTNTRENKQWLDGDSWLDNLFNK